MESRSPIGDNSAASYDATNKSELPDEGRIVSRKENVGSKTQCDDIVSPLITHMYL